jgi:BON domain
MLRRRRVVCIGVLSLVALGTTGCSRRRTSSQIVSNVQNNIRTDGRMQMARVQVVATNGVVTLSGYVTSDEQRNATMQDASRVEGVRTVIDNLRIIDASPQSPIITAQKPSAAIAPVASRSGNRDDNTPIVIKARTDYTIQSPNARDPIAQTIHTNSAPVSSAPTNSASVNVTPPVMTSTAAGSQVPVSTNANVANSNTDVPRARVWPSSAATATPSGQATLPPAPEPVTVPNGTELVVRLNESLSSDLNDKGDTFIASLASPIMIDDQVVIPAEAELQGRVIDVQSAGRFSGRPKLAVEITRITYNGKNYELRSSQYSKQGASRDVRSVAAIGGGAGVGAIIGAIIGGGRGAAIGSVIGAGAGTGAQAASKAPELRIPAETMLNFRLQSALTVIPSSTLERTKSASPGSPQGPLPTDDDNDRPVLKRRPGSPPPETYAPDSTPPSNN